MLVLTRKKLEGIMVGDEIKITIVKIDRNHVRLGIEAPDEVLIVRGELVHDEETLEAKAAWDSGESPAASDVTSEAV